MYKNNSKNLTLGDRVLSIEKHGWKELRSLSIYFLVIYLALKPYSASIFIIEYFKFDPEITFALLSYAFPLLVGIILARLTTFFFILIIKNILFIIYYTLIYLMPCLLISVITFICGLFKNEKIIKFKIWLLDYKGEMRLRLDKKIENLEKEKKKPEQTHIYKSHLALFIIIFIILFSAQFYDNIIGRTWNPKFNKKYELLTNLHYNCQITGGYNIDECNYWKKKYKEYKLTN